MYDNILFPIDLANLDTQKKAAATAADLAGQYRARLHVMTVVPDFGAAMVGAYFPEGFEERALEKTRLELEAFVRDAFAGITVDAIVVHGSIYREIIHHAEETQSDLIVMASHRPAMRDYLLGPNAVQVVTHAAQSVLVVRN
ncbi:MAG: universal stress protein [Alphaproteobacteria bacterium]